MSFRTFEGREWKGMMWNLIQCADHCG